MALHAARPLMREPFAGAFLLRAVFIAVAFLPFTLGVSGCSPHRAETGMTTGYSYWTYPHTAHGQVLSYDSSAYTAVVSLCPDSDVLVMYPDDEPGEELNSGWVFYRNRHFNGENVVTLYCEDEADGKYELPVGPLEQGAYVELSLWLGRDRQGRLKCERIDVVDSFEGSLLFADEFAGGVVEAGVIPNRNFDRGIY